MSSEAGDDEINVTDEWFVPHSKLRTDRPLEVTMARMWKAYMEYQDWHHDTWSTRLESVLARVPRAMNVRGGRLATSFIIWSVTNVGRSFTERLYRDQGNHGDSYFNECEAVQFWAKENMLSSVVRNPLEHLLRDQEGKPVYEDPPHPTLEDSRVIERMCMYLITKDGKDFLYTVYKEAGLLESLPYKREKLQGE